MKTTIDCAVLEMALAALKKCDFALSEELAAWDIDPPLHHVLDASNACGPSIAALQEALAEQPAQPQPEPAWWPAVENILNEYGLQAIDFVADFKAALAQPQQEPVGELQEEAFGRGQVMWIQKPPDNSLLYTSPPVQRKPLTGKEIEKAAYPFAWKNLNTVEQRNAFARAIEAAHGIK